MNEKRYTVEEANELLPHLAPTLVELRDKFEAATEVRAAIGRAAASNGGSAQRERWSRLLGRVAELLDRLQSWQIVFRDVDTGLVDFPATIEGRDAYLCWRLGEPEVAYWHSTDEGFADRRPL